MKALLITLFVFGIFSKVYANEKVIVMTENYPPYNYSNGNKVIGISTEKVEMIMKEAGLDYEIKIVPWSRAYTHSLKMDNVLIYTLTRTEDREEKFDWLAHLFTPKFYLYGRKDGKQIHDLKEIKGSGYTTVCVPNDAGCEVLKKAGFADNQIYSSPDLQSDGEIQMVLHGRVDFFVSEDNYNVYRFKQLNLPISKIHRNILIAEDKGFYLAAGRQVKKSIRNKVRKAYQKLRHKLAP